MRSSDFLKHITLADEEISATRGINQRLGPFSVARITDDLSFALDAIGKAGSGIVVVTDMKRNYREVTDLVSCANLHLAEGQFERQRAFARKSRGKQPVMPLGQPGWPGNRQRPGPFCDKLRVEYEKRNASKMIRMEMCQQD